MAEVIDYTLVLSDGAAYKNEATAGHEAVLEGLSYDGGVWTFTNFNFSTTAYTALKLMDENTTIVVSGTNSITNGAGESNSSYAIYGDTNDGSLTINGAGSGANTLTVTAQDNTLSNASVVAIRMGGSLTVGSNVTVNATAGETDNVSYAVCVDELTIDGTGKLIAKTTGTGDAAKAVYTDAHPSATATNTADGSYLLWSYNDKGYMNGSDPATDVTLTVHSPVAQIGTVKYNTLQEALDAVQAGETIKLIRTFYEDTKLVKASGTAYTLDLNGFTYSNEYYSYGDDLHTPGDVTITDSSADKTGNISISEDLSISGTATVEDGVKANLAFMNDGTLTLKGTKEILKDGYSDRIYLNNNSNGTVEISGNNAANAIYNYGTLNLADGVSVNVQYSFENSSMYTTTISGLTPNQTYANVDMAISDYGYSMDLGPQKADENGNLTIETSNVGEYTYTFNFYTTWDGEPVTTKTSTFALVSAGEINMSYTNKFTVDDWSNYGTVNVDMTDATGSLYLLVDYTGEYEMSRYYYGTFNFTGTGADNYGVRVINNDLYAFLYDDHITVDAGNSPYILEEGKTYTMKPAICAVEVKSDGVLTGKKVTFEDNDVTGLTTNGALLYNLGSSTFTDSVFRNNGGTGNEGGAVYNGGSGSTLTLNNVLFSGNSALLHGGAVRNGSSASMTMTDVVFDGNMVTGEEGKGGAVYNEGSITLKGAAELKTETDTWVNNGNAVIIWDLTGGRDSYGTVKGFEQYSNKAATVVQNIVVAQDQAAGAYVIASGDLSDVPTNTNGKSSFKLKTADDEGTLLELGTEVQYQDRKYQLLNVIGKYLVAANYDTEESGKLTVNAPGGDVPTGSPEEPYTVTEDLLFNGLTSSESSDKGAAMLVSADAGAVVENIIFTGNSTTGTQSCGGALAVLGSLTVNGSADFIGNDSLNGGALYQSKTASVLTIKGRANFLGNSADQGGAVVSMDGTLTFGDIAEFSGNDSVDGGAVYKRYGTLTFDKKAVFTGNTAENGGAVSVEEGNGPDDEVTFKGDASFTGNIASSDYEDACGGAVYNDGNMVFESKAVFEDNSAKNQGGAIYNTGVIIFKGEVSFTGNTLSEWNAMGGAIYNNGSISFEQKAVFKENISAACGSIRNDTNGLITFKDELSFDAHSENSGIMNWDLTGTTRATVSGYQYIGCSGGTMTITVNEKQTVGEYTLASGSMTDYYTGSQKYTFTLTGVDEEDNVQITVGDEDKTYGKTKYSLAISDNGTAEDTTDDKLVLTVESLFGVEVDSSLTDKWFKAGEAVTLFGTYTSETAPTITVGGNAATVDTQNATWTYTYQSHEDTKGEDVTIAITAGNDSAETTFNLKIDTVNPSVGTAEFAADTKFVDNNGKTWFKQGDTTAKLSVEITDATSGLDAVTYNGITYDETGSKFAISTASEVDVDAQNIQAADVAGNENNDVAVGAYGVDGTAPDVPTIWSSDFKGESVAVDSDYHVWVRQNDTLSVTVNITDDKSGLKSAVAAPAEGSEIEYKDGAFSNLDTSAEVAWGARYNITATDNVGNANTSATLKYGVDGSAPDLSVSRNPEAITSFDQTITVTASATDDLSGLKSLTYSINGSDAQTYTQALVIDNNCTIVFTAEDIVGNTTDSTIVIDEYPGPYEMTVTVTADSQYWSEEGQCYTKVYDGTALKTTGFTYDGLEEGDMLVVQSKQSSITDAGELTVDPTVTVYREDTSKQLVDITRFYEIDKNEVKLVVTKREIEITLDSGISKVYDGTADFVSEGFAYSINEGSLKLVEGDILLVTGAEGTAKDAGTGYDVTVSDYTVFTDVNENGKFDEGVDVDVTKNYTVTGTGKADITKKTVTLTSADDNKTYDASALTNSNVSADGFVEGEGASYDVTGTQTLAGNSENTFTYTLNDGTKADNYDISMVNGTLEVTPTQDEVVITITDSFSKVYDASAVYELTTGFTVTGLKGNDTISSITVTADSADAGVQTYTLSYKITHGDEDATASYSNITENKTGVFTINKRAVTVTAGSDSKEYDNTALTCEDFTTDNLVTGQTASVTFTADSTITHWTDGGVKNVIDTVVIKDAAENDVTANYDITTADGTLTIEKKTVTLESGSAEKVYDGTPLTNDKLVQKGFLAGDGCAYTVTGSQTTAGTSENTVECIFASTIGSLDTDYSIMHVNGTLTVTPKGTLVITADDASKDYDGTELTCSGYTFSEGILMEGDVITDVVTEGTVTKAGTAANTIKSYKIMRGTEDVTDSYTVELAAGTLTVNRKALYMTSASAKKLYDGEELALNQVIIQGFAPGEGAICVVTGSQTEIGGSRNTFTYTVIGSTDLANYDLNKVEGNLKVFVPKNDLDGNYLADILMSSAANNAAGAWLVQENQSTEWADLSALNEGWELFGTGWTSAKSTSDVYLKHADNIIGAWVTDEQGKVSGWETVAQFDSETQVLGIGDFNGDAQSDLLLRNTNGAVGYYITGGEKAGWNYVQSLGDEWTVSAIGDLNGDGLDDVVLKHDAGFTGTWLTQNTGSAVWADLDTLSEGFEIAGTGDFNGDGIDDVLLKKGEYYGAWLVENGNAKSWMGLGEFSGTVEQIADFNGDGTADLRVRSENGDLGVQLVMGEDNLQWQYYGSVGAEWSTSLAAL